MGADQVPSFDVVIVGSGIAGALIAKRLGCAGKKVLIMEAGAEIPPNSNEYMKQFYNASAKVPESPYTPVLVDSQNEPHDPSKLKVGGPTVLSLDKNRWQDPTKSYLIQKGKKAFASTYNRIAGGTSHWLGSCFRFLPNDFRMQTVYNKKKSKDWPRGLVNWPITYDTLKPWYGKAEHEIGVSADVQDQGYLGITFPKGYSYPMPKIPWSTVDQALDKAFRAKISEVRMDGVRGPLEVKSTPAARNSQPFRNRRACAGNSSCIPICPIQAKYDATITLNEALATGNVDIWYHTVASEVVVDGNGRVKKRVKEIEYIRYEEDKGRPPGKGCVEAKVFVLAANAIETPRLLLMSKNGGLTPDGVANKSGLVGKNLMDHPYYVAWALMPDPVYPYRGPLITSGIEITRDGKFRSKRAAFRVDIGNEGWNFPPGDPYMTTVDFINGLNKGGANEHGEALFGRELVLRLNSILTRQIRLGFLVEQEPEEKNFVTLSSEKDGLGLFRPQIEYNLSDYTKKGLAAAKQTADKIFATLNAKRFTTEEKDEDDPRTVKVEIDGKPTLIKFHGAGHIVGTYRMGRNRNDSVVDHQLRSWDHKNLFLVGSGVFPTVATGNPTLTLAALSLRAADTICKELKKESV